MRNWKPTNPLIFGAMLAFAALMLAACGTATPHPPTATPQPTATPIPLVRVALPLSLHPRARALFACGKKEGFAVVVDEAPQSALPDDEVQIWWGEPPAGRDAFPIGEERLAVVASRGVGVRSVSADSLARAVIGQITTWEALTAAGESEEAEPVRVVVPTEGTAAGMRLRAWLKFAPIRSDAVLAATPKAALQFVAGEEDALGFVPVSWLPADGVEKVRVRAEPLEWRSPVLALLKHNPSPAAQRLVACLQK